MKWDNTLKESSPVLGMFKKGKQTWLRYREFNGKRLSEPQEIKEVIRKPITLGKVVVGFSFIVAPREGSNKDPITISVAGAHLDPEGQDIPLLDKAVAAMKERGETPVDVAFLFGDLNVRLNENGGLKSNATVSGKVFENFLNIYDSFKDGQVKVKHQALQIGWTDRHLYYLRAERSQSEPQLEVDEIVPYINEHSDHLTFAAIYSIKL